MGKPVGRSTEEMLEFVGTKERENFIVPPATLDPLVEAYEAKHEFLENEVVNLQGDLKMLTNTVELLLDDNHKLRSHLAKRDAETSQLLETIGMNDGETVLRLRKQVGVLEEEMRVLYSQLDQQKELRMNAVQNADLIERENTELKKIINKLRLDLEESKIRQQQGVDHKLIYSQTAVELQQKLEAETFERSKLESEFRKLKDQVTKLQLAKSEAEKRLEQREADARRTEESRLQEISQLNSSISQLKGELNSKDREVKRLEALVVSAHRAQAQVEHRERDAEQIRRLPQQDQHPPRREQRPQEAHPRGAAGRDGLPGDHRSAEGTAA